MQVGQVELKPTSSGLMFTDEVSLQIYGIKCLVKSFLPHKDAQLRIAKLKGLLGVIAKLLISGEVSDDIKSRFVLRLYFFKF
jgi:hypothetical protein